MIQEEHGIEIERMLHHTLINRLRKVNTALCWLFCILAVEKYLQMFKTQLRKFGLASHTIKKIIYGYTDNTGTKEHNQKLSENRANEIIKMGIGKDRLTSKGSGQDNPIAGNDTEDGKSQNRRVELVKN